MAPVLASAACFTSVTLLKHEALTPQIAFTTITIVSGMFLVDSPSFTQIRDLYLTVWKVSSDEATARFA